MPFSTLNNSSKESATPLISSAMLDQLAARFRPAGLRLLGCAPDGSVLQFDQAAPALFARYTLPQLRQNQLFQTWIHQLQTNSNIQICRDLPGLIAAAFPCVEKRQVQAVLVAVAVSDSFAPESEEVLRACTQLQLDSQWLAQQAAAL